MKLKRENLKNAPKTNVNHKTPIAEFDRLKTNSVLFFQIGLIMALLSAYTLLELEFKHTPIDVVDSGVALEEPTTYMINDFKIEQPKPLKEPIKQPKPSVKHPEELKVVKNDAVVKKELEAKLFTEKKEETTPRKPIDESKLVVEEPEEEVSIIAVEHVPVFPGCETQKTRDGKLKCMSKKIAKFVQKKFDGDLAGELGLSGKQRINVMFSIDKNGNVTNLKARAPHNQLEKEAKRVISKLPKITPGKQGNKPVSVTYMMPILFNVQ